MRVVPDDTSLRKILRQYWGYDDFRGIQPDIIRSIVSGHDTLGLMPTGGGKSITFQVPALAAEGLCIVVTPLIALMKDQVAHLLRRGIRAAAVHAGMSRDDIQLHLNNCVFGGNKFLYISPERLSSAMFRQKLAHMNVSFITVDEAHCISQWGYDFRPSYLEIVQLRKLLPHVPVLALTATATPQVVEDIQQKLCFGADACVHRMSFERKNLSYVVRHAEDKLAEMRHILHSVSGSAIVYTRSRQGARDTAKWLTEEGVSAHYYHAGLTSVDKDVRQRAWQEGATRVMVATNAFGMGIDKSDVRLVIHLDLPDSIEAYFQEAGRAGRDGKRAYAVLLVNGHDGMKLRRRVTDTFPDKQYVARVYEHLGYFFELPIGAGTGKRFEFNMDEFCHTYRFFPVPVQSALQLLTRAGYIDYQESDDGISRLLFLVGRNELYALHHLAPAEEAVVTALLRNYGGLFSDYVPIREDVVAASAGMENSQVYEVLKALTRQRILHYIPRKATPHVVYTLRRLREEDICLSEEVYEHRREDYDARIKAMLDYCMAENQCRSRTLLAYFGEEQVRECGHCDVCVAQREHGLSSGQVAEQLLACLADGLPRAPHALRLQGVPTGAVADALQRLVYEGKVHLRDGQYCLVQ